MKTLSRFRSCRPSPRRATSRLLAIFGLILACGNLHAATHVWQGPPLGLWSVAGNWDTGVPTTGEVGGTVVEFGTGTSSVCDLAVTVDAIHFTAGGNTIVGDGTHVLSLSTAVFTDDIVLSSTGANTLGGTLATSLPVKIVGDTALAIHVAAGTLNLVCSISNSALGNAGVRFVGPGKTIISGTNHAYIGLTTVESGTVELNAAISNRAIPGDLTIGTGDGDPGDAVVKLTLAEQIADTGAVTLLGDGVLNLNSLTESIGTLDMTGGDVTAGTLSLGDDITATSSDTDGASIEADVQLNATARTITVYGGFVHPELTVSGVISNGSTTPSGIFKNGRGALHIVSPTGNTYTGVTTVDRGELGLSASTGAAIAGPLVIGNEDDDSESATVLDIANDNNLPVDAEVTIHYSGLFSTASSNERIGALTGSGHVDIGDGTTLTLGTATGVSQFDGRINDSGKLTKTGGSVLILAGRNDYSGLTTIDGGTLAVDGDLNQSQLIKVNAGASLAGTGFISGKVETTAANATIAPANQEVGVLTITEVAYAAGGTLALQINESSGWRNDELTAEGSLDIANCDLTLDVTGPLTQNAYILASYNSRPDNLAVFHSVPLLPAGYSLEYNYIDGGPLHHIALVRAGIAVTAAASKIIVGGATLNGTINPGGNATSWFFQYGTDTQYGLKTAVVKGLTTSKAVSAAITKLNGGRTYHFQLVANNNGGSSYGADFTFDTPGPVVTAGPATNTTATTVDVSGDANPAGAATTAWWEYGLTPKLGSKTAARAIGNGSSDVPMDRTITGLSFGKTYYFCLVATSAAGTSRTDLGTFSTQTVQTPYVATMTGSNVTVAGYPTFLDVTAVDLSPVGSNSTMSYQWYRSGKLIPGATDSTLVIFNTTLGHAGAYICKVSNLAGSAVSPTCELGVIEAYSNKSISQPVGGSATLSFKAAGNNLTYQWLKNELFAVPGATAATLVLANLQDANSGRYSCVIDNGGGSPATASVINLAVNSGAPVILPPVTPDDVFVNEPYSYQIPINTSPRLAPSGFTIKNLPPGLTVSTSGLITGRIVTALTADKTFTLSIKATNASGSSAEVAATLTVHPFPAGFVGTYNGLVRRDTSPGSLDGGLGGMFTATIGGTGACTGKFTLGGVSQSFTLPANYDSVSASVIVEGTLTRTGKSDLNIGFQIFNDGNLYGAVFAGLASGNQIAAAVNPWKSMGNPFPNPGFFTNQITITSSAGSVLGNSDFPQGRGYATVNINTAGTVTWTCRMADGSAPATFSTTMAGIDPDYGDTSFPVQLMLYSNTGSSQGFMYVGNDFTPYINGSKPLINGYLDWAKNPQPEASKDRTYKDGFPAFDLDVAGGIYTPPDKNVPVLGLTASDTPGDNNARMEFNEGGLSGPDSALINRDLRVTPANTADFTSAANTGKLTLKIDPKTGLISGSFLATDGGVSRTVPYNGLIILRDDVAAGAGFFLRPDPTPSATMSPILSGEALLLKN